jgi:hypothetical protein
MAGSGLQLFLQFVQATNCEAGTLPSQGHDAVELKSK